MFSQTLKTSSRLVTPRLHDDNRRKVLQLSFENAFVTLAQMLFFLTNEKILSSEQVRLLVLHRCACLPQFSSLSGTVGTQLPDAAVPSNKSLYVPSSTTFWITSGHASTSRALQSVREYRHKAHVLCQHGSSIFSPLVRQALVIQSCSTVIAFRTLLYSSSAVFIWHSWNLA